jgi:ADP-ribose pyrophosphatase
MLKERNNKMNKDIWRCKKRKYVYKAKNPDEVSFVIDKIILPSGKEFNYGFVDCPYQVVIIVGVDERNRILMLRQYRYLANEELLELPSGSPNPGESLDSAALRELEEETGYKANKLIKLNSFYSSIGITNQLCHIYLAYELQPSTHQLEETEGIRCVEWIPITQLLKMIKHGEIMSVGTAYGVILANIWLEKKGKIFKQKISFRRHLKK